MAVTVIQDNNKLVRYTEEINREFVRGNQFSPYMSEGLNAVIRIRSELKAGGEDMNIPIVSRHESLVTALLITGVMFTTMPGCKTRNSSIERPLIVVTWGVSAA